MAGQTDQLTLGQQVVIFAESKMGKEVGTGECYDLADEALRQAEAKSAPDYGKITETADYRWGRRVKKLDDAMAGDILQFRGHRILITTVTTTRITHPDGSWEEKENTQTQKKKRGHHTAIVARNPGNGILVVFEQHVKPLGKRVQRHTIEVASRPTVNSEKASTQGNDRIVVKKSVTISVKGKIRAYRPVPKPAQSAD